MIKASAGNCAVLPKVNSACNVRDKQSKKAFLHNIAGGFGKFGAAVNFNYL